MANPSMGSDTFVYFEMGHGILSAVTEHVDSTGLGATTLITADSTGNYKLCLTDSCAWPNYSQCHVRPHLYHLPQEDAMQKVICELQHRISLAPFAVTMSYIMLCVCGRGFAFRYSSGQI